jgi:hypothetical protein
MSPLEAAFAALRDELLRQIDLASRQFVTFVVTDTAPLTVTLAGGTTEVAARGLDGSTYSVADTGMALVIPNLPPILLKTV